MEAFGSPPPPPPPSLPLTLPSPLHFRYTVLYSEEELFVRIEGEGGGTDDGEEEDEGGSVVGSSGLSCVYYSRPERGEKGKGQDEIGGGVETSEIQPELKWRLMQLHLLFINDCPSFQTILERFLVVQYRFLPPPKKFFPDPDLTLSMFL